MGPLAAMLGDTDSSVRRACVEALQKVGSLASPYTTAVLGLLKDDSAWVRLSVAACLARLDVKALLAHLEDKDPTVRRLVLDALGELGADSAPYAKVMAPYIV